MNRIFLMGLIGLMGLGSADATPQASDADLKSAQVPPVILSDTPNFGGLRVKITGSPNYPLDIHGGTTGSVDFTGLTALSGIAASANTGVSFLGMTDLYTALAAATSGYNFDFSSCGMTDVTAFIDAWNANTFGGSSLFLNGNTLAGGALGRTLQPSTANFNLSLSTCGLTTCPTLVLTMTGTYIYLEYNLFTAVDLSNAAQVLDGGQLNFYGCTGLTAITAGDGTSTGITSMIGGSLSFGDCALTTTAEDNLLTACVAMEAAAPGQNARLDFSGGTSAAPDGTGTTAITSLAASGWTISTN